MSCCCCPWTWALVAVVLYLVSQWVRTLFKVDVKGRTVLITGCDTGFGNKAAKRMHAMGMKVIAACLTDKGVDEFRKLGIAAVQMDVTNEESVKRAMANVASECGNQGLYALINNAGLLKGGCIDTQPLSEWKITFDVNVMGIACVTAAAWPLVRKAKGRVINVASIVGRIAFPACAAYSGSKHAVEGLSDSFRREFAQWGVKTIIIEPGVMKTNLYDDTDNLAERSWNAMSREVQELYGKEYFATATKNLREFVNKVGGEPEVVVETMVKTVTHKYPFHRYGAGSDVKTYVFLSMLPSFIVDFLFAHSPLVVVPAALQKKKK